MQANDADTYLQGAKLASGLTEYQMHIDELAKLEQLQPGSILQQGQPQLTREVINAEKAKHCTMQREVEGETAKDWPIAYITEVRLLGLGLPALRHSFPCFAFPARPGPVVQQRLQRG